MPVTDDPASNSTITIIIILAVIVGLLIVIIITGILIVVCWRIRKTKTFTPTEHEYSSVYATIDEMQEVLTQSNEAYSAALLARPRKSSDSVGYEVIDGEEDTYNIANSGESRGGRRTVRKESSSGHGVYEVIDEADITAGDRDIQTANQESSDHNSYEDMNKVASEDVDGESSDARTKDQVEQDPTQNEDYVSMKDEETTTENKLMIVKNENCASTSAKVGDELVINETEDYGKLAEMNLSTEIMFNEERAIETVQNEAYASNLAEVNLNVEMIDKELAIETVQNEAYASTLTTAKMAEASCEEIECMKSTKEVTYIYENVVVKPEDEVTSAKELPPYENVYKMTETAAHTGTSDTTQTMKSTGEKGSASS